jgi:hypothetical protein
MTKTILLVALFAALAMTQPAVDLNSTHSHPFLTPQTIS